MRVTIHLVTNVLRPFPSLPYLSPTNSLCFNVGNLSSSFKITRYRDMTLISIVIKPLIKVYRPSLLKLTRVGFVYY